MTRISKFLFALLIGFTVTTATACDENPENNDPDLSVPKADAGPDLSPKD